MKIAIWWEQTSWGGVDTHLVNLLANWPNQTDSFRIYSNKDNEVKKRKINTELEKEEYEKEKEKKIMNNQIERKIESLKVDTDIVNYFNKII